MTQTVLVDLVPDDLHVGGHGIRFLQGQWISLQLEKEVPLILLFPIWVVGSPLLRSVR